jgi:hypothetical protein
LWNPKSFQFILPCIKGGVATTSSKSILGSTLNIIFISRIASKRAGVRYWMRGADLEGNVAIEVECEAILSIHDIQFAFRILRGSVPLQWNQNALSLSTPSILFSNVLSSSSQQALQNHFSRLLVEYKGVVTAVDLIGSSRPDRNELSALYEQAIVSIANYDIDYHQIKYDSLQSLELSIKSRFIQLLRHQHYYMKNLRNDRSPRNKQSGVFRINGLDCIDETSIVTYWFFELKINQILNDFDIPKMDKRTIKKLKSVFLFQMNEICFYYAGTEIKKQSVLSESFLTGGVKDMYISACRFYISRFQDYQNQDRLDLMMREYPTPFENIALVIQKRRRLFFQECTREYWLSAILLIKRYFAPREIRSFFQFIFAMIWMFLYVFLIKVVGVEERVFIKVPKSLININQLPHYEDCVTPENRGLIYKMERLNKDFTVHRGKRMVKNLSLNDIYN